MTEDHRKALATAVRWAGREAEREYKRLHPDAGGLRLRSDTGVFKPRPKSMRGYALRLANMFLSDPAYLKLSNADLARLLSQDDPGYTAPANLLTERFKPGEKQQVAQLLANKGIPIDLRRVDSPSKLKTALRAHWDTQGGTTASARVTFTPHSVTVNGRSYPINGQGRLARIQIGKRKISVAALRDLITAG